MKTFAIGDIHGCYDAMIQVVKLAEIIEIDQVIWLGDYVDRGPDSAKVIRHLASLPVDHNTFLRGNHEVMMHGAMTNSVSLSSWAQCGGDTTLNSYSKEFNDSNSLESVPSEHWNFIENLKPYHETETHIFVHASVDAMVDMSDQTDSDLYWGSYNSIAPHQSGKRVICGHSSQKDGIPKSSLHATCIDTWAYGHGWLTCLNVATGRYFQANQNGDTRTDWLSTAGYDSA